MARLTASELDVIEEPRMRSGAARLPPPVPGTAVMDPKRQNFTMGGGNPTGARQPFDVNMERPTMRLNAPTARPFSYPPGGFARAVSEADDALLQTGRAQAVARAAARTPTVPDVAYPEPKPAALTAAKTMRGLGMAAAPTAVGAVMGGFQRQANEREAASPEAPSTPPQGPGEIPVGPYAAPPRVAEVSPLGVGPNTPFTRGAANLMNAVSGGFGALRAGSTAARALTAGNVAEQAIRGGQLGNELGVPSLGPGTSSAMSASATPRQPFSDAGFDAQNGSAPAAPGNPNIVMRSGNSFSGDDIKAGFTYGGDGAPKGSGTVTSLATPGVEGYQRQLANIRSLGSAPSQSFGDGGNTVGQSAGGFGGATQSSTLREKFDSTSTALAPSSLRSSGGGTRSERMQTQRLAQEANLEGRRMRQSRDIADAQLGVQRQSQGQALQIAGMNSNTQRDINANNNAVSMRGQDQQFASSRISNEIALRSSQRDQRNKDREFEAGRGDATQSQRNAREKTFNDNIDRQFTDRDGKVDAAAAAQYRQGFDRAVARLGGNSIADLDTGMEQKLTAASGLLQKMKDNAGLLPWKPDKLSTIDPLDLVGLQVDPKTGDRIITREGKARGERIPGRFFDTEEGSRIRAFNTPTNRYDMLELPK